MKRLLVTLALLVLSCGVANAQQSRKTYSTVIVGNDTWVRQIASGIQYHQLSWNITGGTAPTCQVELDYSNDGITSLGTVIAAQTCTSNGFSSVTAPFVANYVRISVVTKSGLGTVNVVYLGYTTNPSTGGGGSGGAGIDCSTYPGADIGAKWLACVAATPDGGLVSLGNFTSPQTLTTAVTITRNVTTNCGGLTINQGAAIVLGDNTYTFSGTSLISTPDQICTFNKTANIDQITLDGPNNLVSYVYLNGNRGTGKTGAGIVVTANAANAQVSNVSVTSESTTDILDAGAFSTQKNSVLADYGTNGLWFNAAFLPVADNLNITDSGDSTGNALKTSGIITRASNLHISTTGLAASISNEERLYLNHSFVVQGNGYPAYTSTAGAGTLTDNFIQGGGANGPAIFSHGNLWLEHNPQISDGAFADIVQAGGGIVNISNNGFIFIRHSGNSAINLNFAPTLGAIVSNNIIQMAAGDVPTGDNYGIRLTPPAAGDFIQVVVKDNVVDANNNTTDHGFFFDNTAGNVTANFNRFQGNQCIDMAMSSCIVRTDAIGEHTTYQDNETNLGTSGLYAAGGGVNDIVIQLSSSFTFATLPTAGAGSQVVCSDCTAGVLAGSGAGGTIFYSAGRWGNIEPTTAPTVSSGFGTGAAVAANPNGPTAFRLSVGTTNTGTGIIALPAAKTGWNCYVTDITTTSVAVSQTKQKATGSDATHAALQNYTDVSATGAWVDNDVLAVSCFPF